jgi:hypothetical protein
MCLQYGDGMEYCFTLDSCSRGFCSCDCRYTLPGGVVIRSLLGGSETRKA